MGKELSSETRTFIDTHAEDNVQRLALQAARYPHIDMAYAIIQIAARQKARSKLPTWWQTGGLRYPHYLSMEQCSSEATARYKASLIPSSLKAQGFTDLTGGFGVDFCCMAEGFSHATYVERQAVLCELAGQNFPLLGILEAEIINSDATDYLKQMPRQGLIYIDPARRDSRGKKTVAISDCEPDLMKIHTLLTEKAERVMIKLSPMLDINQTLEQLPHICDVYVIASEGECKELLIVMEAGTSSQDARIHSVNLSTTGKPKEDISFTREEENNCPCLMAEAPGLCLYEPNASILKAGAFRIVAHRYGLKKLHPNSHLYTSDKPVEDFPGRCFEVIAHGGFGKRELRDLQKQLPKANLTLRNFPSTTDDLRKRMKLADGGEDYLFATTFAGGEKRWIWGRKWLAKE